MNNDRLKVSAIFDKSVVSGRGRSVRYLAVETTTSQREKSEEERAPLNIAIVIDASTSMAGEPMRNAKMAAAGVVNSLKTKDRLSLISFGHDVQVHLTGVKQTKAGREKCLAAIDAIEHRLYTNLSGGWLKGAEAVATTMEDEPGCHNHVILLSDGHANHGILDPLIIRNHAQQLRLRALSTSTVGIGNKYSATLLQELAEFGGGRMHDAEHPLEIIGVVMGEMNELANTYVDDIALHLKFPEGCEIENISGFPTTWGKSELVAHLGALAPSASRTCIFRVSVPSSESMRSFILLPQSSNSAARSTEDREQQVVLEFDVDVVGKCTGTGNSTRKVKTDASLRYSQEPAEHEKARDKETSLVVARVWHASVVKLAADLNRLGKIRRLKDYLEHEIKYFSRYCNELPDARELVLELELLRRNADQDWHERLRKEMQVTSSKFLTTTSDYRPFDRLTWAQRLKDEPQGI